MIPACPHYKPAFARFPLPAMRLRLAGAAAAISVILAGPGLAGEINDQNGIAIKGNDPVAYFRLGRAVAGSSAFSAQHMGTTFLFVSAAHRDAFKASPEAFAPQYGGFCAFGTARGYKADIDPEAFTISGGKLYLNYSKSIQGEWARDIPGFVAKADVNWPSVALTDSVTR